jgi:hypothetical protein
MTAGCVAVDGTHAVRYPFNRAFKETAGISREESDIRLGLACWDEFGSVLSVIVAELKASIPSSVRIQIVEDPSILMSASLPRF